MYLRPSSVITSKTMLLRVPMKIVLFLNLFIIGRRTHVGASPFRWNAHQSENSVKIWIVKTIVVPRFGFPKLGITGGTPQTLGGSTDLSPTDSLWSLTKLHYITNTGKWKVTQPCAYEIHIGRESVLGGCKICMPYKKYPSISVGMKTYREGKKVRES